MLFQARSLGYAPRVLGRNGDAIAGRASTGVLFLTLFLDLVGFSIIFPLFPELLEHYLVREGPESLVGRLVATLERIAGGGDESRFLVAVLFGGVLGSIYSLLQFLFSPIWGRISDRIGRRPVLLLTVGGMAISYLLWIFSTSFALFLVSRVLGGAMSGNISTATAAMADITSREDRARGMGIIGAAFGLGFILGPAIGGGLAQVQLQMVPSLENVMNPFSAAALGAFAMSALNLLWVARRFGETLPPQRRGVGNSGRSANPVKLFAAGFGRPLATINVAYFVFIVAFSGMEFTLTFLVRERLGWDPMSIGMMFVYVGLIIAVVQGGIVRRLAPRFGEKRVAIAGLLVVIPGLAGLAHAFSGAATYLWLAPMAIGSALAIPSLTAWASLLAPAAEQGAALGVFRSLGALGRAAGPFVACALYWQLGGSAPYLVGAAILVVPILLALPVAQPSKRDGDA